MRIVIQRSLKSTVEIDGQIIASIDKGLVLLVGITHDDTVEDIDYCVRKVSNLRIFEDQEGKMNLSLKDTGGNILSISQFTLYGHTKKGNRPSFINAADPLEADQKYQLFNSKLREHSFTVETGQFGANMQVNIVNDGPVTILIDSKNKDL